MSAPKGNNYNMKFKTPEARKKMYKNLIAHLEQGYHQDTFPDCDWDTVERYMKDFPKDFPTEKITEAKRKGFLLLEKLGHGGMTGAIKDFNTTAWIFIMKNKLHWKDRHDVTTGDEEIKGPVIYVPEKNKE